MGIFGSRFRLSPNGYFMELRGPAWTKGEPCCQKKLCFVATDRLLLAELLGEAGPAARLLLCQILGHTARWYVPGSMLLDRRARSRPALGEVQGAPSHVLLRSG